MTKYDLEERTLAFAKAVRTLVRKLPYSNLRIDDERQLLRSSGSVTANYGEANEAISKADFLHRIKICRKEAKESMLWLKLLEQSSDQSFEVERESLVKESQELVLIFAAILRNSKITV